MTHSAITMMNDRRIMPAEWDEDFGAVMIAWPHADTDWAPILPEAIRCYRDLVKALMLAAQKVVIVTPSAITTKSELGEIFNETISIVELPTNDTWARDFGPITTRMADESLRMLDFTFNAWGMKFAADKDNRVVSLMAEEGFFADNCVGDCRDWILEGGSVESDGQGCIMTTSQCLLAPNRNQPARREDIEAMLCERLGAVKVLWLDHGGIEGDDTDGHIDTLARFAPDGKILYAADMSQVENEQSRELRLMADELKEFTDADGTAFTLIPLPLPAPIYDLDGCRLPATYANYLVTATAVIVPTYGQPASDMRALEIIACAYPGKQILGVDCTPLIKQHGSLHCVTMQIPLSLLQL